MRWEIQYSLWTAFNAWKSSKSTKNSYYDEKKIFEKVIWNAKYSQIRKL